MKDETGNREEKDEEKCLNGCKENIAKAKRYFHEAESVLKTYYGVDG